MKTFRNVLIALLLIVAALFVLLKSPLRREFRVVTKLAPGPGRVLESGPVVFSGQVNSAELGVSPEEWAKLRAFVQENAGVVKQVEIKISKQDSYAEMGGRTELYMDVLVHTTDRALLKPPTLRLTRDQLVEKILWRAGRDLEAYEKMGLKGGGETGLTIINVL